MSIHFDNRSNNYLGKQTSRNQTKSQPDEVINNKLGTNKSTEKIMTKDEFKKANPSIPSYAFENAYQGYLNSVSNKPEQDTAQQTTNNTTKGMKKDNKAVTFENIDYQSLNAQNNIKINTSVNTKSGVIDEATAKYIAEKLGVKVEDVNAMADELSKMAKSKGVDSTEYVSARLVDFLRMRKENSNISLDKMNEELALNKLSNMLLDDVTTTYSNVMGQEVKSIDDLLDINNTALLTADYEPELKSAYMNTREFAYIQLAQEGDFKQQDYYNCLKNDLANLFPQASDMTEAQTNELLGKIDKLDLDNVKCFINKCITLPSIEDENYQNQYNSLVSEFNSTTSSSTFKGISNPDMAMDVNSMYKEITGVDFNADNITAAFEKLNEAENINKATNIQRTVENIQIKIDNGDISTGDALWQMAYLSTGSTEDKDILEFIKTVSGNENVTVQNGSVIIDSPLRALTRGDGGASVQDDKQVLNNVVEYYNTTYEAQTGCKNTSEADTKLADILSDSSFYQSLGNKGEEFAGGIFLGGSTISAGLLATGPIGGLGAGAVFAATVVASDIAMKGAVISNVIGDTLEFAQKVKQEGVTTENLSSYAWEMTKNAGEFALTTAKVGKMIVKGAKYGVEFASNALSKVSDSVISAASRIFSTSQDMEAMCIAGGKSESFLDKLKNIFSSNKSTSQSNKLFGYRAYRTIEKIGNGNYCNTGYGPEIIIDIFKDKKLLSTTMQLKHLTKNLSELEKADFLYKYMLDNFGLSRGAKISSINSSSFPTRNLLGDIFSNPELIEKAVCRHRAIYFQRVAKSLGLKSYRVIGDYCGTCHAWNMVEIDGKKYMFDTMLGVNGIPCDDLISLGVKEGTAKYGAVFATALAIFTSTNLNAKTTDNIDNETDITSLNQEEYNNFMRQMEDFKNKYTNDPTQKGFIDFMDSWTPKNSDIYNWKDMVKDYTKINPNKVVLNPDSTATYQGIEYGSMALWSYMNDNKYAADVVGQGDNKLVTYATDGQRDANGNLVDLTKLQNVDVIGSSLNAQYTDSQGREWNTLSDCIAAHKSGFEGSAEDWYKQNPGGAENVQLANSNDPYAGMSDTELLNLLNPDGIEDATNFGNYKEEESEVDPFIELPENTSIASVLSDKTGSADSIDDKDKTDLSKKKAEANQKAEFEKQQEKLERQRQNEQNLSWSNNNRGYFNTTLGDGGINDFASNNVTFDFFGNAQYSTFGQNISYYAMDDYSNMITRVRGSGNGGYGPHLA